MSKSIQKESDDRKAATLRKRNSKGKERFDFNQWDAKHREGWDEEDDEFGIHEDERRRY